MGISKNANLRFGSFLEVFLPRNLWKLNRRFQRFPCVLIEAAATTCIARFIRERVQKRVGYCEHMRTEADMPDAK